MKQHTAQQRYEITLRVNRDLLTEIRNAAALESRSINSYLTYKLMRELMPQHFAPQASDKPKKK